METWKEFEANELTHSGAHHLLAIYEVGLAYGGWARVSDIARRLDITRGSVSVNLRALKKRGWVETDEHHMVKLSARGLKAAHSVMAKRVVVKAFLSEVLDTPEPQQSQATAIARDPRLVPGDQQRFVERRQRLVVATESVQDEATQPVPLRVGCIERHQPIGVGQRRHVVALPHKKQRPLA